MRNVSDSDVAAFRYLRPRMDENVVRMIELSQLPRETLDFFSTAFANKKISKNVAFAYIGTISNPDMCVHVADFFIKLAGISWAVVPPGDDRYRGSIARSTDCGLSRGCTAP